MSNRVTLAAMTVAATVVGFGTADAADLPIEQEYIIEEPIVEYHPPAYYARVDCAYAFMQVPDMIVGSLREHYVQKNGGHIKIKDGWACGLGLGFRAYENVRFDLTVEHRGKFEVDGVRDPAVAGSLSQQTHVSSWVGLANIYYDVGNYYGFTPYVGAGMGFAHNRIYDSVVPSSGFTTVGDSNTDFAWALMAGTSYDIDEDLALDIGYRYINFGGAASANYSTAGTNTTPVEVDNLDAHEIRVGLRYNFW
jgi:opacity protein-like surface antigen